MPGSVHEQLSSDKIIKDDENMPDVVSVEYLIASMSPAPHRTNSTSKKVGALVFFIRNILTLTAVSSMENGEFFEGFQGALTPLKFF